MEVLIETLRKDKARIEGFKEFIDGESCTEVCNVQECAKELILGHLASVKLQSKSQKYVFVRK